MITKKEYCRSIIYRFKRDHNIPNETSDEQLVTRIYQSTSLGIALEELGIITEEKYPEEFMYLSDRGGFILSYFNSMEPGFDEKDEFKTHILTTRDLLSILPDKLDEE